MGFQVILLVLTTAAATATAAILIILLVTLLLASLTHIQQFLRRNFYSIFASSSSSTSPNDSITTSLFCGRVSHIRYKPVLHTFSYPLFLCLVDLAEVGILFGNKKKTSDSGRNVGSVSLPWLWPLNYLMTFREEDHLKNGEGLFIEKEGGENESDIDGYDDGDNGLGPRIRRLVSERTGGKCTISKDQKILLLTHLSYYGYCFNPVSFYYILKDPNKNDASSSERDGNCSIKDDQINNNYDNNMQIEAIVAEVSNTPWNEMRCQVLHPDSVDIKDMKGGRPRAMDVKEDGMSGNIDGDADKDRGGKKENSSWNSINYIFEKKLHASAFMDMDHLYDCTFWDIIGSNANATISHNNANSSSSISEEDMKPQRIVVSASMLKQQQQSINTPDTTMKETTKLVKYFHVYFDIHRAPFTPFHLCYQLMKFPVYCLIIVAWIHIEGIKLFAKGLEFLPHPEGSKTGAEVLIGHVMAPVFAVKDWLQRRGICDGDGAFGNRSAKKNLHPKQEKTKND